MSEASTQKLIVYMTCAFGVVLVLAGYIRQPEKGFERLPLDSTSVVQAPPTVPRLRRSQPTAEKRVLSASNQSSEHWQSIPAIVQPSNVNVAPARNFPNPSSSYDNQSSIGNFFTPITPNESRSPTRRIDRHPTSRKIGRSDYQIRQSSHQ